MRNVLAAPLAPAAAAALAVALVSRLGTIAGVATAIVLAAGLLGLALASADRTRRLAWSAASGVAALAGAMLLVGPLPGFDLRHAGPLDGVRDALSEPLRRLIPEPESGIVRGIVLGERASVDADLSAAFARSGTTHLLAISGFNMTLVATGVGIISRGRLPPAVAAATTVAAVVGYSVLVGLAPSVVRAALMAAVAAFGVAFGRRAAIVNALALGVAAMVALDRDTIGDVGFLLSAAATAGLLFLGDPFSRSLGPLPKAIREGLATTLAATFPTLPIIAAVFGRISLISPAANLVAVPLFPPLMLAGAVTALTGVVSLDLARVPALAVYAVALALRTVVEWFAALPLASVAVPDGPGVGVAMAVLVGALIRFGPASLASLRRGLAALPPAATSRRARAVASRVAALAVVALAGVVAACAVAPTWVAPAARLRALDVGQGDAFLVEASGRTLLVDGGPDPARLLAELGASLPPWTRRIDVVALTHAHADHGDGLLAVLERYEVGLVIEPVGLGSGPLAAAWSERIARARIARRAVAAGTTLRLGDATLTVLSPEDTNVDPPCLVLRLERGPFSVLFMGDATEKAQADLLLRPQLATRIYVPPHHGAATPHASALVEAIRPSAALISVGAQNRYGHPTPETLAALERIATYRTDRDGTVELTLDGNRIVVRTHANGLPPPRGRFLPHAPPSR